MPDSTEALITGLRRWTRENDTHVRAAVELLIWHGGGGYWLRRADFRTAAVKRDRREAWIDWRAAREFVDAGSVASTSEMAILDLAVALGENRYRLSIMGAAHSRAIADAVTVAAGLLPGGQLAALRTERRRIRSLGRAMAVTLRRPDGSKVEAVPVADLDEVIGSDG